MAHAHCIWITNATNTHSQRVIITGFLYNNCCRNGGLFYIIVHCLYCSHYVVPEIIFNIVPPLDNNNRFKTLLYCYVIFISRAVSEEINVLHRRSCNAAFSVNFKQKKSIGIWKISKIICAGKGPETRDICGLCFVFINSAKQGS